jgi:hypothetical protein
VRNDRKKILVIRKPGLAIAGAGLAATLVGLAVWHGSSAETWAGVMLLTTCGVLMLAVVGAICRGSNERPQLIGFAMFGWGYFALARWYTYHQGPMPTVRWLAGAGDIHNDLLSLPPDMRMAHDAWTMAFAVGGVILAGLLVKHRSAREPEHADRMLASDDPADWWRGPAFAGLLGLGLVAAAAVLADGRWEPQLWAGTAFLLTWALVGLAVLGAICSRARRREAWFGSACFGIGYLILAFGPAMTMTLPTNHFLNAVFRPGGPTTAGEQPDDQLTSDDDSQRVRRALQEPIALHFPEATSLKVVLEHIKNAARASLGKNLVLYASSESPTRMEVDKAMVTIDRAKIPAEDGLRLCLVQVGLTFRVQSGYVRIMPDAYHPVPFEEDPVMIAGHSLLALFAAALGAVGAPFVAGLYGRHRANSS